MQAIPPSQQRLIIITGPSGAGRSTAINVLEDLGFEAIDNLPLSLVPRLTDKPLSRPIAIGLDVRNRDFSTAAVLHLIDDLQLRSDLNVQTLFLDASEDVLVRRFSETRRRHPLALGEPALSGIRREADILAPIRQRAEMLIDTSELSPHRLKARLADWFGDRGQALLGISLQSFSFKRGTPKGLDMTFDCRFLKNPYWEETLRQLNGTSAQVAAHIETDPRAHTFITKVTELLLMLLPAFREEGKAHLTVGFGCTGGQHRSVYVTEQIAFALAQAGWQVSKRHRELDRAGKAASQAGSA